MIKKFCAMLAALALSVCVFTGCNNSSSSEAGSSSAFDSSASSSAADSSNSSDSSEASSADSSTASSAADDSSKTVVTAKDPSLTIDGKKMDITNFTICTIDGTPIDFMMFRYFYFVTLEEFEQQYGADVNTIRNIKGGFEGVMTDTVNRAKNYVINEKLAKENNITLSDDEKKKVEEDYKQFKTQFSSDAEYETKLKNAHLTEDLYKKLLMSNALYEKIDNTLFKNDGKYATKKADFKNIVKDTSKYAHETHILIPYCVDVELDAETKKTYDSMSLDNKLKAKQQAYAALDDAGKQKAKQAAKAKADEALKKALAGQDFSKLLTEYGWDTTLAANNIGYYFSKDNVSFPKDIVEKTFTLKENEVAKDIVDNEMYGFFIIKRLAPDMDTIEKNIDSLLTQYDLPLKQKTFEEKIKALEIKTCDNWDKITIDSIT